MSPEPPRVLIVLPYAMMARNFIESGALGELSARGPCEVLVVSPDAGDAAHAQRLGMRWEVLFHPRRTGRAARLTRAWWSLRHLAGVTWRMALVHRFNRIQGFRGFAIRLKQSWRLRRAFLAEGLPMSRLFGLPLPRSAAIYAWLYGLYYRGWQRYAPVDALFREFRPHLLVLGHLQTPLATPYVLAARAGGVPMLGLNGSWDQPTTKGPLCPGVDRILVQNQQVRQELSRYHGVPDERIVTVGWPQMDPYADSSFALERRAFLGRSGYGETERYIVFAANPGRLGHGEARIAAWIAERLQRGDFGADVRLHLRCHPNDTNWRERFVAFAAHPVVRIEPPSHADLPQLANLIRHAEVVVASAGSMNLDALALDTPTIGLAWEDEALPYWDRQARGYEFEHLAAVADGAGFPLARGFAELEALIREALQDRARRAPGRRALRQRFIEPLDGRAAARIAGQICDMARRA